MSGADDWAERPIGPIVPIVPSVPDRLTPPAFLEDEEGEGSEWGWSDWDAPELSDYRDLLP